MGLRRALRWLFWLVVLAGIALALSGAVEPVYVFAPLLGLIILRVGFGTLASFDRVPAHVPDGEPQPVDPRIERTTYRCGGCGAELLLVVRGTPVAPRHCGEGMSERTEVARDAFN